MACIQPDGHLTRCGEFVLLAMWKPATPEEVAHECGVPLFRIRSAMREFFNARLITKNGNRHVISAEGIAKLEGC
jgi:hypothetical protein